MRKCTKLLVVAVLAGLSLAACSFSDSTTIDTEAKDTEDKGAESKDTEDKGLTQTVAGLGESCAEGSVCANGLTCNPNHVCAITKMGDTCSEDDDCTTGLCMNRMCVCSNTTDCGQNQVCDLSDHQCIEYTTCPGAPNKKCIESMRIVPSLSWSSGKLDDNKRSEEDIKGNIFDLLLPSAENITLCQSTIATYLRYMTALETDENYSNLLKTSHWESLKKTQPEFTAEREALMSLFVLLNQTLKKSTTLQDQYLAAVIREYSKGALMSVLSTVDEDVMSILRDTLLNSSGQAQAGMDATKMFASDTEDGGLEKNFKLITTVLVPYLSKLLEAVKGDPYIQARQTLGCMQLKLGYDIPMTLHFTDKDSPWSKNNIYMSFDISPSKVVSERDVFILSSTPAYNRRSSGLYNDNMEFPEKAAGDESVRTITSVFDYSKCEQGEFDNSGSSEEMTCADGYRQFLLRLDYKDSDTESMICNDMYSRTNLCPNDTNSSEINSYTITGSCGKKFLADNAASFPNCQAAAAVVLKQVRVFLELKESDLK